MSTNGVIFVILFHQLCHAMELVCWFHFLTCKCILLYFGLTLVLFRLCHLSKQKFFQYTCHGRPISIETRAIVNINQVTVRLNCFNNRSLCVKVCCE